MGFLPPGQAPRLSHYLDRRYAPEVLAAERGVVQNEKRDAESGPLGPASERLMEGLFPRGHPYGRPVLGSIAKIVAVPGAAPRTVAYKWGNANARGVESPWGR